MKPTITIFYNPAKDDFREIVDRYFRDHPTIDRDKVTVMLIPRHKRNGRNNI